jgi:hypothetical protein
MSQFTLKADPNALNSSAINAVVNKFNSLPGAADFLNITNRSGSTIWVTDNPNSSLVSKGNQAKLGTLQEWRALDQTASVNNVIIFNPNPPDDKPLISNCSGAFRWASARRSARVTL